MDPFTSGVNTDDAADIDQFRPAKKMKLEAGSLDATEELREEMADDDEDWDSIYDIPQDSSNIPSGVEQQIGSAAVLPMTSEPTASGVATESQDDMELKQQHGAGVLPLAAPGMAAIEHEEKRTQDGLPAAMIDQGDELVAGDDPTMKGTNAASTHMNEEITAIEDSAKPSMDSNRLLATEPPQIAVSEPTKLTDTGAGAEDESSSSDSSSEDSSSEEEDNAQQIDDPDIMTAPDSDPEPDDAESSSESEGDDDNVESLDPAELAAMLMNEEAGEGGQSNGDVQPRTQNERTDLLPTPQVTVTPEMRKTPVGLVSEHLVDQMALIPSDIAGSDQVLDFGSLLCNDQLQVVGVVQDTIGRVQGPMYVTYCKDEEMRHRVGLLPGAQIYFVNDHSKFVFTRNLPSKGTDASNIHDEEIDEEEQEFSDDEKEAEYKRLNKENKKAGNGKLTRSDYKKEVDNWAQQGDRGGRGRGRGGRGMRGDRGRGRGARFAYGAPGVDDNGTYLPNRGDKPTDGFSGGLNYDDDEPTNGISDIADGDYNKHVRPDNLAELMTQGGGAPVHASRGRGDAIGNRGREDRGRGDRSRGRGGRGDRGDRGRGRGDFQRGGRGGNSVNGQRTSNNSYPDAHNNHTAAETQQTYHPINQAPAWTGNQNTPAPQPQAINPQAILSQLQQQQQQQPSQSYQFNGQQYQYTPQHSYAASRAPAGGYVNPAFSQPQPQQQQAPQWTREYQQWPTPQHSSPAQAQQWQPPAYQQLQAPQAGWYQGQQAPATQDSNAILQNALHFLQHQQQHQGRQQ